MARLIEQDEKSAAITFHDAPILGGGFTVPFLGVKFKNIFNMRVSMDFQPKD
jgi:hypothetical protein